MRARKGLPESALMSDEESEGTLLWPPRPASLSPCTPSTATCLAAAPLTPHPPRPQRRVKISHTSASTCLRLVPIWMSTHLCPHHGSSWLPQSGRCLGARRPFFHRAEIRSALLLRERCLWTQMSASWVPHGAWSFWVPQTSAAPWGRGTGRKGLALAEPLQGALQVENRDTKGTRIGPGTRAHPVRSPHSSLGCLFPLHLNPGGQRGCASWGSCSHEKLVYYSANIYYPPPHTVHRVHFLPLQFALDHVACFEQEILVSVEEQRLGTCL